VKAVLALSAAALLVFAACGDDGPGGASTPETGATPDVTVAVRTPAASPSPGDVETPAGAEAEVQGIVGAVDEANRSIAINRLQGADVETVEIGPATRINDAV
jgi:hypothetical protein